MLLLHLLFISKASKVSPETITEEKQQGFKHIVTTTPDTGGNGFISAPFLIRSTWLLMAYFGVRMIFLALNVASFVPPDEVTHAGLCKIFSQVVLLPENSSATYEFGLVTNTAWLYYWIMGKLLYLNVFGISDLIYLRLFNIPLAFGTIFFVRRTLLLLTHDRLADLLLLVAMTNTAMFTFLSASVSYDNLVNLLAAMAIYYLLAFFTNRSGTMLAAAILCQLAGSLTKVTFLPLVLALNLLLFMHEFRRVAIFPATLKTYFLTSGFKERLLALMIVIALAFNLHLYAGNYLHFETLTPSMSDVFPANIATQYRIVARETVFREYSEGRISYMDALVMTGEIKHPGDKADTFYLLMNYENLKRNPRLWMGPLSYAKVWFEQMMSTTFGIKGHLPMYKNARDLIPIYLMVSLSLFGFFLRWRPRDSGWLPPCLGAIALFYAGFLMYKINYSAYLYYGTPGITLQGRYLFPVIGPVYILACYYLLNLFRADYIRYSLVLATALVFISYDFPWFLMHATPEWYR